MIYTHTVKAAEICFFVFKKIATYQCNYRGMIKFFLFLSFLIPWIMVVTIKALF